MSKIAYTDEEYNLIHDALMFFNKENYPDIIEEKELSEGEQTVKLVKDFHDRGQVKGPEEHGLMRHIYRKNGYWKRGELTIKEHKEKLKEKEEQVKRKFIENRTEKIEQTEKLINKLNKEKKELEKSPKDIEAELMKRKKKINIRTEKELKEYEDNLKKEQIERTERLQEEMENEVEELKGKSTEEILELQDISDKLDEVDKYEQKSMDEEDELICEFCGKECSSAAGLASHKRACKENPENK